MPPAGVDLARAARRAGDRASSDGVARLRTELPTRVLAELCGWAAAHGIELERLEVTRPTLEDVYLELVQSGEATAGTAGEQTR